MKEKILIGVSILLVIGIAIAVYFNIGLSNENEGLTDHNKQLSEELEELEDDLDYSKIEVDYLETDIATLVDETTTLTSELEDATKIIKDKKKTIDGLEASIDSLSEFGICDFSDDMELGLLDTGGIDREINRFMLLLWYFISFGEIIDGVEEILWADDPSSPDFILYQTESEDWDGFLIFYDVSSGVPDGVFFIDGQCWVEFELY